MAKENKGIKGLIGNLLSQTVMSWTLIAAAVAATVAVVLLLHHLNKGNSVEVVTNDKIDITPTQIEQIRSIGQWEFLSISDEELIDTVRHGFFSDDELVRIYYGTLRLGLDLSEARPDWIVSSGDSITMTLPRIKLLDKRFIDEGRTRSFFESGKWSNTDRAALYERARKAMMKRCLTPINYRTAEQNAKAQMQKLMLSMGLERPPSCLTRRNKKKAKAVKSEARKTKQKKTITIKNALSLTAIEAIRLSAFCFIESLN